MLKRASKGGNGVNRRRELTSYPAFSVDCSSAILIALLVLFEISWTLLFLCWLNKGDQKRGNKVMVD
jgi:hypothetical protein